ncbi:MAG: hypothetical protein AB1430_07730 [Pseudomonadota bacterium]
MRGLRGFGLRWAWPVAAVWARWHERRILRRGQPLTGRQCELARALGLARPECVRVMVVPAFPLPGFHALQRLGWRRLPGLAVRAITLGHGIYCIGQPPSWRLLAHELWHVRQVERAGSLRAFIADYLRQVAQYGYWDAPLEVEAREAARGYSEVAGAPCSAR